MINLSFVQKISKFLTSSQVEERKLKVEVDNRNLNQNSLFIAIKGARFNPLEHLDIVASSGCQFVLYEKGTLSNEQRDLFSQKIYFYEVDDLTTAIADIGREVARLFQARGGEILAISGSNGKTTTKEMCYFIGQKLIGHTSVICTQKNNNNHLGVPFSLFQITEQTKLAIIELGSNAPGEIEFLCQILNPSYGVTTNIGETHLEFFQTKENVFKEEGILRSYTSKLFFCNNDDEFLKNCHAKSKVLTYGFSGLDFKITKDTDNDYFCNLIPLDNRKLTGTHNFINLSLASIMLSQILNLELSEVIEVANNFEPTANRSEWMQHGEKEIFLDAYNANPSSMKVSLLGFLEKLGEVKPNSICLIVGDMNELGANAKIFHEEMAEFIGELSVTNCIFVGKYAEVCRKKCTLQNVVSCSEVGEAGELLAQMGDTVKYIFIKGSRSLQLERILDTIER